MPPGEVLSPLLTASAQHHSEDAEAEERGAGRLGDLAHGSVHDWGVEIDIAGTFATGIPVEGDGLICEPLVKGSREINVGRVDIVANLTVLAVEETAIKAGVEGEPAHVCRGGRDQPEEIS